MTNGQRALENAVSRLPWLRHRRRQRCVRQLAFSSKIENRIKCARTASKARRRKEESRLFEIEAHQSANQLKLKHGEMKYMVRR